ncbi:hypothetical protein AVEN_246126-1 [Araneus ventricosus]|uniref:Uncharacterized protein n=1 Tax=Araneus ventricosus TaxID=182803 RepID=A0A4Y2WYF2_ARAVE|nr:hypothetical protein AVEN_246126-1 [Araneus ventricosus]
MRTQIATIGDLQRCMPERHYRCHTEGVFKLSRLLLTTSHTGGKMVQSLATTYHQRCSSLAHTTNNCVPAAHHCVLLPTTVPAAHRLLNCPHHCRLSLLEEMK